MALRREALDAHQRGDHAGALALLRRALSIRPSGSLHGVIVRELTDLAGDAADPASAAGFADALAHAEVCLHDGPREPPSPARETILTFCREQVAAHTARFGRVVVELPPSVSDARVTVADRPLVALRPGVAYVEPGNVVVEVAAPGHGALRREVAVARGASATVRVTLTPTTSRRATFPVGLVVGGLGVAALLAGGVTWLVADGRCHDHPTRPDGGCYVPTQGDADAITALDDATTTLLAAGAGLTVVGVVLHFALRATPTPAAPHLTIAAGVGSIGLRGAF